jgi:cell division protein FtsZ
VSHIGARPDWPSVDPEDTMSIRLQVPEPIELRPRLTVIGVGGAGCNAVNNMIAAGLDGVDFVVANTDAQALVAAKTPNRIQLGQTLTEGLGAGSRPEIGEAAAREAEEDVRSRIAGSHMLFIAAGMGGGTGTGAAAVIAKVAKDLGILTVAVVTKPFLFEGTRRMRAAEAGIAELKKAVDTLIVIPNQNLFRIADERTTFAEAFILADQVLYSGIACIVDLIVKEGLINLDLADVKTVLKDMGPAVMGTGEAEGDRRAVRAAEAAIENKLLDDVSLVGAKGLLLSIIGGRDLTLYEVDEAASRVRQEVDPDADIIVGAAFDDTLGDRVRVSIVASGLAVNEARRPIDAPAPVRRTEAAAERDIAIPATTRPPIEATPVRSAPPPLPAGQVPIPANAHAPKPIQGTGWAQTAEPVVTEMKSPIAGSGQRPPPLPPRAATSSPQGSGGATFVPDPAVEIPRRTVKTPEIGDFSPVIQKAYADHQQAQAGGASVPSKTFVAAPKAAVEPSASDPKNGSLFRKLARATLGRSAKSQTPGATDEVPDFLAPDTKSRRG